MLLWEHCRHHFADLHPKEPSDASATTCRRQQLLPATSPAPAPEGHHRWHTPRTGIMGNLSSCLNGGQTGEGVAANMEPVRVTGVEVGLRCCFYWLSGHAENLLSAQERMAWMEAAGKGECQDDALAQQDFRSMPGSVFAGVFDGHGHEGRLAASFAAREVPKHLAADARVAGGASNKQWTAAFTEACVAAHTAMGLKPLAGFDAEYSGTTACMALLNEGHLITVNVGDSRAMLARRGPDGRMQGIELTHDAKPNDPLERRRIEKVGGMVSPMRNSEGRFVGPYRVFGRDGTSPGLAMSRSLGDLYAHSLGVIPAPTCTFRRLTPQDEFVVLASDGVWEVMSCTEVAHFVARWRKRPWVGWSAADALTLEAQERWKQLQPEIMVDDVAVVVIMLTQPPRSAVHISQPPPGAVRAGTCNAAANSAEAKAARDVLASLPYQNLFRHLQLERLDSLSQDGSSHGGGHVRFGPDTDAPAPPGKQAGAGNAPNGAAALRRALSRNTIVPRDVFGGEGSSENPTPEDGSSGAPSDDNGNNSGSAPSGGPAAAGGSDEPSLGRMHAQNGVADAPRPGGQPLPQRAMPLSPFHSAATEPYVPEEATSLPSQQQQHEQLPRHPSGLPRVPSREAVVSPPTPQRSPSLQALQQLTEAAAEQPEQLQPPAMSSSDNPSPFDNARQRSVHWSQEPPAMGPLTVLSRANSSPSHLRMAALSIPEHEAAIDLVARATSASGASAGGTLLRPIRKAYPSQGSLSGSPQSPSLGSASTDWAASPMQACTSVELLAIASSGVMPGSGDAYPGAAAKEGRVRNGMPRHNSTPNALELAWRDAPAVPRSQSTRALHVTPPVTPPHGAIAPKQWAAPKVMTSAFANLPVASHPLNGNGRERHARKDSINPWADEEGGGSQGDSRSSGEGTPRSAKRGRGNGHGGPMRGVQRGGSAAMDVLRACSSEPGLDYLQAAAAVESGSPPLSAKDAPMLLAATPSETEILDITPQDSIDQPSAHSGDSASSRHSCGPAARSHIRRAKQAAAVRSPDSPMQLVRP